MVFTRRKLVVVLAAAALISVLLYTEHPSVRAVKSIASALHLVDSEKTVIGMTDVRSIDHTRGDSDADVILIDYSDFNCVMCSAMQESFERLVREQNVLLVSRHLYLNAAGSSFDRAVAAECIAKYAGDEAYFTFSRYLYDNQYNRPHDETEDFARHAATYGITARDFQNCVADDVAVRRKIRGDNDEGWRLGARGTPYIVVVYKEKPIGISYANKYSNFLDRVRLLVRRAQLQERG